MYKNILIVKLSAIGDVIHALPVVPVLKQQYPEAKITWVVEKPAFDLLTNNPYIDDIIIFDKPKFKTFGGLFTNTRKLAKQLKDKKIDLALDLQGLFKSAAIVSLSGAHTRLGYCNMREFSHLVSRPVVGPNKNGHVVERYLDVVRSLGCEVTEPVEFPIYINEQEAETAKTIAVQAGLHLKNRYAVLAPGTNWSTKCWPVNRFAELADKLYRNNIVPVLVGGAGDKRLSEKIIELATIPPIDLTGKTSLKQLAYLIKGAGCFVGGDTGPMHLAAAVHTPVVVLFGATDPKRNGPYGEKHRILKPDRPCLGCWKKICPHSEECLENIEAELVFQNVVASMLMEIR